MEKLPSVEELADAVDSAPVVPLVPDPFLNTEDACGYLGVPKATLLTWRVRRPGYGPRAVKAGGRLKYRLSELDRWLRAHEESYTDYEDIDETPLPLPRAAVRTADVPIAYAVLRHGRPAPMGSPENEGREEWPEND